MKVIQQTPTYILEANVSHDAVLDIHTLDLFQTWPTMAKPDRRRVAQVNLRRADLAKLGDFITAASLELEGKTFKENFQERTSNK